MSSSSFIFLDCQLNSHNLHLRDCDSQFSTHKMCYSKYHKVSAYCHTEEKVHCKPWEKAFIWSIHDRHWVVICQEWRCFEQFPNLKLKQWCSGLHIQINLFKYNRPDHITWEHTINVWEVAQDTIYTTNVYSITLYNARTSTKKGLSI
jgi:hypothetical protein